MCKNLSTVKPLINGYSKRRTPLISGRDFFARSEHRVPSGQKKPGKPGKGAVFRKSQGKPGKVRESL